MSWISGKVGDFKLHFLSVPHGTRGSVFVGNASGDPIEVRWQKDAHGIWIELPASVFGFDIQGEMTEEGGLRYRLSRRGGGEAYSGLCFLRSGEEVISASAQKKNKGLRVKSQMPGKIVRILVKEGEQVEKGAPLLVMEAMKMENQIRAPHAGEVKRIAVQEGTTVETGAELMVLDAG